MTFHASANENRLARVAHNVERYAKARVWRSFAYGHYGAISQGDRTELAIRFFLVKTALD